MSARRARLAAYVDQRRRMGEPGIVPGGLAPGELLGFLAARAEGKQEAGVDVKGVGGVEGGAENGGAGGCGCGTRGRPRPGSARRTTRNCAGRRWPVRAVVLPRAARPWSSPTETRPGASWWWARRRGRTRTRAVFPSSGRAGRLLDLILASVSLSRKESVYICNVLKCRPPGNRNPMPDEIESCAPLLKRQIQLVAPEVLLAVGSFAAQWLTRVDEAGGKAPGRGVRLPGRAAGGDLPSRRAPAKSRLGPPRVGGSSTIMSDHG